MKPASKFSVAQIKSFVDRIKNRVGGAIGWDFVGHEVRVAMIRAEIFNIMKAQPGVVTFSPIDMQAIERDMMVVAGIEGWV